MYFVQRFIVFTVNLRWALDPDRYDLDRKIRKVHLGLWKDKLLIGGARVIFPEEVEYTLTFSEESFRAMLPEEVAKSLRQNRQAWVEVTRLYVLGKKEDRGKFAKALFRGIYQYGIETGHPILVMVVNNTLLKMFERYRFAYKIVGACGLRPANRAERKQASPSSGLVPHYVVVLNLTESQETVTANTLAFFNDGLRPKGAFADEDTLTLWNSLAGLTPAEINSLVSVGPSKSWRRDTVVAVPAAGG